MTYGIIINNNSGQLTITDETITPWFAGKLTAGAISTTYHTTGSSRVYTQSFTLPGWVSGRQYLVAFYIPDSSGGINQAYYIPSKLQGDGTIFTRMSAPNTTPWASLVPVEVYAFGITTPPASASTYGLRLYNSTPSLTFDSGYIPLSIVDMPNVDLSTNVANITGMPTKPAILPCTWYRYRGVQINPPNGDSSDIYEHASFFARFGTGLYGYQVEVLSYVEDAAVNYNETWGSISAQPVPVINAALYD